MVTASYVQGHFVITFQDFHILKCIGSLFMYQAEPSFSIQKGRRMAADSWFIRNYSHCDPAALQLSGFSQ
jgi:hypothetical protein